MRALGTLPLVTVFLGKFKTRQVTCTVRKCKFSGNRSFSVPEEKRTDVNIAIHMLEDARRDIADRFILVSGDSDLVPAILMLKQTYPKKQLPVAY